MRARRELIVAGGLVGALALAVLCALSTSEVEPASPLDFQAGASGSPAVSTGRSAGTVPRGDGPRETPFLASLPLAERVGEVAPTDLAGAVVDGGGRPLAGATVRVALANGVPSKSERAWRTGADGCFALPAPGGAGDYVLRVALPPLAGRMVPVRPGQPVIVVLTAGGTITGTCRDPSGRALPATVSALAGDWEAETRCSADGRFQISGVPSGLAALRATASGYLPGAGEVVVTAGGSAEVSLELGLGQSLRVRASWPGAGAGDALRAMLRGSDGELIEASGDGELVLSGLPSGEAQLLLAAPGHSLGPLPIDVPLGADPDPIDVTLLPDPVLSGAVLSADGAPLQDAVVSATPDGVGVAWPGGAEARCGPDGAFRLPALPRGSYRVAFQAPGFARESCSVTLSANDQLSVALTAEAGVRALVLDRDGRPLPGATLRVSTAGEEATRVARTGSDGQATLGGLTPGPVLIQARCAGAAPDACELVLPSGQITELTLTLGTPRSVRGVVQDEGGRPIPGAAVLLDDPLLDGTTRTDAQGEFVLEDLPAGPLALFASAGGHTSVRTELAAAEESARLVLHTEHLVSGVVRDPGGALVDAFSVAPAEAPQRATWFRGGRFSLVVGPETRELLVRSTPERHHHGEESEAPPALAPARVSVSSSDTQLEVVLSAGFEAEGTVVDAAGRPVPGAAILAGEQQEEDLFGEGGANALGMSEDGGAFHVGGLPPRGLTVTVSHPRHAPLRTVLVPGEDVQLRLPAGARVAGLVRTGGEPVAGVGLVLEGPCVRRSSSGPEGEFSFEGLAAGRYTLTRVDTESSAEVDVRAGAEATIDLEQ